MLAPWGAALQCGQVLGFSFIATAAHDTPGTQSGVVTMQGIADAVDALVRTHLTAIGGCKIQVSFAPADFAHAPNAAAKAPPAQPAQLRTPGGPPGGPQGGGAGGGF